MYSFPPLAAAIGVLHTVLASLTTFLTPALGGSSAAAAIVALTMAIRLCLLPVARAQVHGEHRRAQLAPDVRKLTQKYEGDPERLRRELSALYAKEGTSPMAGCLPMLVQAPVFTMLYGLFITSNVGDQANVLLSHSLAGAPLTAQLGDVWGSAQLLVFVVLMALLAVTAWATRRQAVVASAAAPTAGSSGSPQLTRLMRLLPFGMVVIAAVVPLAASLYLLTSASWTVTERAILRRALPHPPM